MGALAVISRQRFSPRPMRKAVEAIQTRKITEMKKTDPTRAERAANFFYLSVLIMFFFQKSPY